METVATVRRWMAGLLAVAYLTDIAVLGSLWGGAALLVPLPMVATVFLALRRPVLGGLACAGAVLAMSVVLRERDPYSFFGVQSLLSLSATEALAGMMVIAIVIWRTPRGVAAAATLGLLASAVCAVLIRRPYWHYTDLDLASVGAVLAVGAGVALRLGGGDSPMRTFLRGQWPLALALTLALLVDSSATLDIDRLGPYAAFPLLAAVATAVCAVLGPRDALHWTINAAVIVAVSGVGIAVLAYLLDHPMSGLRPPAAIVAAQMALVAYVVRYCDRQKATSAVVALVGADALATIALAAATRDRPDTEFFLVAAFLLLLSVATGQYFGSRDRARNQSIRVAVSGAQQAERMALARELHDVVAHHVTGIVVQAQAAQLVADPAKTAQALAKIERSGTEALAAMRMLVGSMRGTQAGEAGAADAATADLAADLRAVAAGFPGPEVHMELSLPDTLPPEAGRTVLRIVQESLTNVSKHAQDASRVSVTVEPADGELRVRVSDDATTARVRPAGGSGGYGLVGMRERVELLGGAFAAGPGETAGWTVDARFPLRKDGS
ncbi:sensor histidine kinase [Actinokineospora fastidiosa]|uniref:histidine kinase n=1 Tax=Actinokineospora fastidiosa TaxID=1816 RepID=A0A918G3U1_9PSEU|nr:histidine kinase [Actinokineospora fastidiosa]GGS18116.1 two-component sensor histidine kinase [Actinokineospora fastidiosa]